MAITKVGEASGSGNSSGTSSAYAIGNIVSASHTGRLVLGAILHQNTSTWDCSWDWDGGATDPGDPMTLIADILVAAAQEQRLAVWALMNPHASTNSDARVKAFGSGSARYAFYSAYYTGVEGIIGGDATGTSDGEGTGNPKTLDVVSTNLNDLVLGFLGQISLSNPTANSPTVDEGFQPQDGTGTDTGLGWGRLPGGAGTELSFNGATVNWGLASLILQGPIPTPRSQAVIIG